MIVRSHTAIVLTKREIENACREYVEREKKVVVKSVQLSFDKKEVECVIDEGSIREILKGDKEKPEKKGEVKSEKKEEKKA